MEHASEEAAVVRERYARFAREEAAGRSEVYRAWSEGIASDVTLQDIIARLPAQRRQPPLVFAVARMLGASVGEFAAFREWVIASADDLIAATAARALQTNEPLRCAALLPALAGIPGPLALVEVGASAGLCLYPDRYAYRYTGAAVAALEPPGGSDVRLECEIRAGRPPLALPEVVWRAGIDLRPLDAAASEDRAFLTGLVWPGEAGREQRITAALDIAAADPPTLVAGDATDPATLRALAAQAPAEATLVVTTPGVLPHIPRAGRDRLIATIRSLDAVWVSLDPPGLHDAWGPRVDDAWGGFVVGRDGEPLGACDPLGAWVEWRTESGGVAR